MTNTETTTKKTNPYYLKVLTLLAALAVAASLLVMPAAKPAHAEGTTFTVNSTNDRGNGVCNATECTLAEAINDANNNAGADVINFNIPGSGVHTIKPGSPLPDITERVTIDGYTQQDSKPNTLAQGDDAVLNIELDGSNAGSGARGLQIDAEGSGSVVKGLAIHSFGEDGIFMAGDSTQNKIEGNFIGTDPSGTKDLGNADGVNMVASSFNTIGGNKPEQRNLISGSLRQGVLIHVAGDATGNFNRVEGNLIGTQKDGTTALGNSLQGVLILRSANNTISGNTIAFNGSDGVVVASETGNLLFGNSIFSNTEQGIDLNADGVTANDSLDPDTGPNALQNFPVLTSAKTTKKGTTITGTLNSTPNKGFIVQFFSNASGGDEGQKFIGQTGVTTDGSGNASFTFKPAQKVGKGQKITATATDTSAKNTSEFSAAKKVVRKS